MIACEKRKETFASFPVLLVHFKKVICSRRPCFHRVIIILNYKFPLKHSFQDILHDEVMIMYPVIFADRH